MADFCFRLANVSKINTLPALVTVPEQKHKLWQLGPAVIGIIAVEFRKEEDKEETAQGSDLHLCSNPAHISPCCPRSAGCGGKRGQD